MKSDFLLAVAQLANERHLPREMVVEAVEAALASAYKKDSLMAGQDITVRLDPGTAEITLYVLKRVVEEVTDPKREISLEEALQIKPGVQFEDTVEFETQLPSSAGRIAAQTAKQVVLQRLREAEREQVYTEYVDKEGDILTGQVQRFEASRQVILDVGRAEALLPYSEQVPMERLRLHQRLRVYVLEVQRAAKGPGIIVSRTHKNLLRRIMELEVPEIYNGVVEVMAISREPGSRSKVAVVARQDGVDAVGSCVGMRGNRIQNIVKELQDERIDVIQWHRDPTVFIANALSPAQVLRVELSEETEEALVVVPDRHLSLAIGREGQNARLAARITGWKIDIKSTSEVEAERLQRLEEGQEEAEETVEAETLVEAVAELEVPVEEAVEAPAVLEEEVATVEEAVAEEVEAPVAEEELALVQGPMETTADAKPSMTPEEELALQALEEDLAAEEEEEEEEVLAEDLEGEEIWSVPRVPAAPSGIRFAEDILGPRGQRGGGRRGRGGRAGEERPGKGRKARAGRSSTNTDQETPSTP